MEKNKILSDILNKILGDDIDNNTIQELADHIKKCEDCKMDIDTIQQTIKLVRAGDFEVLLPPSVSKRLFKVLDLNES